MKMKMKMLMLGCAAMTLCAGAEEIDVAKYDPRMAIENAVTDSNGVKWVDGRYLPIEGRAFSDVEHYYDRLPRTVTTNVNEGVRSMKRHTTGLQFRFVTDSRTLRFRWRNSAGAMHHMPSTGVSGIDVYRFDTASGKWRYVKTGSPKASGSELAIGWNPGEACLVNLPLYNGVSSFSLGIDPSAKVSAPPPRKSGVSKPVVFYGTSITHGGCCSRPGMSFVNIIGRDLDVPVVNLGFSGSGRMELEMSEHLAAIDASCYVLDCLWNMSGARWSGRPRMCDRYEPFIRNLRAKRPGVPIVMAERCDVFCDGRTDQDKDVRRIFEKLCAEGWRDIVYLPKDRLYTGDCEGTVDGSHPNDWGMMSLAKGFGWAIREALGLKCPTNPGEPTLEYGAGFIRLVAPGGRIAWSRDVEGTVSAAFVSNDCVYWKSGNAWRRVDIVAGAVEDVASEEGEAKLGKARVKPRPSPAAGVTAVAFGAHSWPVPFFTVGGADVAAFERTALATRLARPAKPRRALVITRAFGYAHNAAMSWGDRALRVAADATAAFSLDFSNDVGLLAKRDVLDRYDAVVLNNCTLVRAQRFPGLSESLRGYVKSGRGLCLIHSSVDSFYDDPAVQEMNGGRFCGHPWTAGGVWSFRNERRDSPLMTPFLDFGANFRRSEEIYVQSTPPFSRANCQVLVSMDLEDAATKGNETSWGKDHKPLRTDGDYAVSWTKSYGDGRVFYTSFGHDRRAFLDPARFGHILLGLQYCLGDIR